MICPVCEIGTDFRDMACTQGIHVFLCRSCGAWLGLPEPVLQEITNPSLLACLGPNPITRHARVYGKRLGDSMTVSFEFGKKPNGVIRIGCICGMIEPHFIRDINAPTLHFPDASGRHRRGCKWYADVLGEAGRTVDTPKWSEVDG